MFTPESGDVAYFGCPYPRVAPPPPQVQHTSTIRLDANLKKDSVALVPDPSDPSRQLLEFTFDSNSAATVTVHFVAKEAVTSKGVPVFPLVGKDRNQFPGFRYAKGLGQEFKQSAIAVNLSDFPAEALSWKEDSTSYPLIISITSQPDHANNSVTSSSLSPSSSSLTPPRSSLSPGGEGPQGPPKSDGQGGTDATSMHPQCQITYCTLIKKDDGSYKPKMLKQKIIVDGVAYVLQEIYGIENSVTSGNGDDGAVDGLDDDDYGSECVICMVEPRDTTVLPCRHMCLCSECAERLRYQTNKCPICRSAVQSLLQIKVSKKPGTEEPEQEVPETPAPPAASSSSKDKGPAQPPAPAPPSLGDDSGEGEPAPSRAEIEEKYPGAEVIEL